LCSPCRRVSASVMRTLSRPYAPVNRKRHGAVSALAQGFPVAR